MTKRDDDRTWFLNESIELDLPRGPRLDNPRLMGVLPYRTEARLVDMSVTGVGLETFRLLPIKHRYRIEVGGERPDLRLEGQLMWNKLQALQRNPKGETAPLYRCGLQFESSSDQSRRVQRFLNSRAGQPNGGRKPPRFFLRGDRDAMMITPCPFEVRSISESGALLEIDLLPDPGSRVDLLMDLPSGPSYLAAEVIEILRTPTEDKTRTQLAVRFIDAEASSRDKIRALIERTLS